VFKSGRVTCWIELPWLGNLNDQLMTFKTKIVDRSLL